MSLPIQGLTASDLISQLASASAARSTAPPPAPAAAPAQLRPASGAGESRPAAGGFASLVGEYLQEVNGQQLEANRAIEDLAAGRADNVHGVVLTAVKADLSVRMLFEIRNQVVQAYQEVMRMQL